MLEIKNISKKVGSFSISNTSLSVDKGDYCVILGKSGSGKSLLLELIAGILSPDKGEILLNNIDITDSKTHNRKIGLVFQDWALFPHLSVQENIAYALKVQKVQSDTMQKKILQLSEEMEIGHLLGRMPESLSGGEKQRVALARTMASLPRILLLDEPLVSLDIQLRTGIMGLLRKIHQKGQTIIHVTHDYEEAITLGTRIAVMNNGEIIQTGSPEEVFQHPKNEFVANFIGIRNFFRAIIETENKGDNSNTLKVSIGQNISLCLTTQDPGKEGYVMIRGEEIVISNERSDSSACNNLEGLIKEIYPGSNGIEVIVDVGVLLIVNITKNSLKKLQLTTGKKVWLSFKASAVKYLHR
jgi:molybdopterin-binding protein